MNSSFCWARRTDGGAAAGRDADAGVHPAARAVRERVDAARRRRRRQGEAVLRGSSLPHCARVV